VKEDSRDPLEGMERPRARKQLSSAEVALLDFLARGTRRRRKSKVQVQAKESTRVAA
jgi:hypothetical protein